MSNTQKGGDLHPVVGELLSHTKNNEDLVLSLAIAIDVALDKEQGCGTGVSLNSLSSPKKFGEWANLCKAAFALAAWKHNRDGGRRGAEVTLNEAVHSGWCYAVIHGAGFQTEGDRERRFKRVAKPFWLLPPEEQVKDETAVAATQMWLRRYVKSAARGLSI